jgi:hypothetical protein
MAFAFVILVHLLCVVSGPAYGGSKGTLQRVSFIFGMHFCMELVFFTSSITLILLYDLLKIIKWDLSTQNMQNVHVIPFVRGFTIFARLGPQTTITFILCEELRKHAGLDAI